MDGTTSLDLTGRNIVLAGAGTVEILRSLQAALIDLGCTVYCRFNQEPFEGFDRPVDAVFFLELFDLGVERIDALRAALDEVNPDAPIFDIALAHPLLKVLGLGLNNVDQINQYMSDRNIVSWVMCPRSAQEFEQFGLSHGLYQPLGLCQHYYLDTDHQWLSETWVNSVSPLIRLEYGEAHRLFFPTPPEEIQALVTGKAIFLGTPTIDVEDQLPVHAGAAIDQLRRTFPPESKALYGTMLGYDPRPDLANEFIQFHFSWIVNVPLQRRRLMLQDLTERFGDRLSVFGDGWDRYLPRSLPTSTTARLFYRFAACCLDFGSLQFDATCYPRTSEILKCGGLLIAGQSADGSVPSNRFRTFEELASLVDAALDTERRPALLEAQAKAVGELDLGLILPRLLSSKLPA